VGFGHWLLLGGIVLQIIELPIVEFPASGVDGHRPISGVVALTDGDERVAMLGAEHLEQVRPIERLGDRHVECREDRRSDIDRPDELPNGPAPVPRVRELDDQGNLQKLIEERVIVPADASVLAEFLSVIGCEHHERAIVAPHSLQVVDQISKGVVDGSDLGVVGVHDVLEVTVVESRSLFEPLQQPHRDVPGQQSAVILLEEVEIPIVRSVGVVYLVAVQEQKEWTIATRFHPLDGGADRVGKPIDVLPHHVGARGLAPGALVDVEAAIQTVHRRQLGASVEGGRFVTLFFQPLRQCDELRAQGGLQRMRRAVMLGDGA
jgi:hypothetical protein